MKNAEETTPLLSAYAPEFNPHDNEHALQCPECGNHTGLHLDGVTLENASGDRLRVEATGEDRSSRFDVQQETDANHNGRRHQVSLLGWCEICAKKFSLTFRQHKGMTFYSQTVTGSVDNE